MQGEQFQVQDRAHPPAVPDRPDFVQYLIAGIVFGLALGAGTTAAREAVDQAVRSEEEFSTLFPDLPVYGVIPSLDIGPESRFGAYATARGAAPRIASALVPLLVALLAGLTVLIASLA